MTIYLLLKELRSLHTDSEISENKYDLMLYQSRLHTASENFVCQIFFLDQVRSSAFLHLQHAF